MTHTLKKGAWSEFKIVLSLYDCVFPVDITRKIFNIIFHNELFERYLSGLQLSGLQLSWKKVIEAKKIYSHEINAEKTGIHPGRLNLNHEAYNKAYTSRFTESELKDQWSQSIDKYMKCGLSCEPFGGEWNHRLLSPPPKCGIPAADRIRKCIPIALQDSIYFLSGLPLIYWEIVIRPDNVLRGMKLYDEKIDGGNVNRVFQWRDYEYISKFKPCN